MRCPLCGAGETRLLRSAAGLARDLAEALTDGRKLMHSNGAAVFTCDACGSVFRDPRTVPADIVGSYRDDEYGEAELTRLRDRALTECAHDHAWLRAQGLAPGARVLEIGSYVGALLSHARGNGCDAIGVDVGREVSAFARACGLDVETGAFDDGGFPAASFDVVFVLNCFEQLPDPGTSLDQIRRVRRPGGRLVVRTPSADFARRAHRPRLRRLAAANGILGVPFLRCLSSGALDTILRDHGFKPRCIRGRLTGPSRAASVSYAVTSPRRRCPYPWMDVAATRA